MTGHRLTGAQTSVRPQSNLLLVTPFILSCHMYLSPPLFHSHFPPGHLLSLRLTIKAYLTYHNIKYPSRSSFKRVSSHPRP